MSHTVIKYFICFKNGERQFLADENKAKKLQQALMSENCPKFFELDESVYSVSSVDRVIKESEYYQN